MLGKYDSLDDKSILVLVYWYLRLVKKSLYSLQLIEDVANDALPRLYPGHSLHSTGCPLLPLCQSDQLHQPSHSPLYMAVEKAVEQTAEAHDCHVG